MHTVRLLANAFVTCALILGGSILVFAAIWCVLKTLFRLSDWLIRKRGTNGES